MELPKSLKSPRVPHYLGCLDGATAQSEMDKITSPGSLPVFGSTEISKRWKPLM